MGKGLDLVLPPYLSVGFIHQKKKKKEDHLDSHITHEAFLNGKQKQLSVKLSKDKTYPQNSRFRQETVRETEREREIP